MGKLKIALSCASALALCVVLAGCAASSGSGSAASSSASSASALAPASAASASASSEQVTASAAASSAAAESASASAAAESSSAAAAPSQTASNLPEVTADELAGAELTIEFGQFEEMQALSKAIQNGEMTGQVVKIDGVVLNFGKGMSYGIAQQNEAKSARIGTTFVIEGVEEEAYPPDGTHIVITGKVCADPESPMSFKIYTLPEFVEVVSE